MFVDSHCHLNYLDNPTEAVQNAIARGVERMLCIGVDEKGIREVLALAHDFPEVFATVGEHPGSATTDQGWMDEHIDQPKVLALGEMGLDYFYEKDASVQHIQRQSFTAQMEQAHQRDLPVVIHTRSAKSDTLAILREFPSVIGVLHCFTEDWDMAKQGLDLGYFISISGIVTFNKATNVREVAKKIPLERLLIETDSPWLAPVPHRGQQNQPAFVTDTAQFVSELRGEELAQLAGKTSANFNQLFRLT